jgi:plastocyanin
MRFSATVVALSALVAPALAQGQDHQVMVGPSGLLIFDPPSVTAVAGDTVTFVFNPKNHTVTQSTFAAPCTKMANGLASGFQPVAANASQVPAMTITVNDTTPLWFYCGQTTPVAHCGKGMVFAVNPTADKSFTAFQTAANATLAATNTTTGTGSTSNTTSTTGTGTGSGSGSAASPSASATTGTTASGALGMSVRGAPLLAALGIVAGLLL